MKTQNSKQALAKKPKTSNIQRLYTEIAKIITSSLEVSDVIKAIMNQVQLFFKPRNWSLLRFDTDHKELYFAVTKGIRLELVKDLRIKLNEGIAGHIAQTQKAEIINDADRNPYFSPRVDQLSHFKTHSVIAVPITFQKQILGVIELINIREHKKFTAQQLEILQTIADFAAIALVNAMRYEKLRTLANNDPLTGLYNRERLNKLIKTCEHPLKHKRASEKNAAVVACIDVNKLKYINDTYGHRIGDEVLQTISSQVKTFYRESDFGFRIGGDEFLIVLLNLTPDEARLALNRLKINLKTKSKHAGFSYGFSYGVARGLKQDISKLIDRADKNMYKNKHR